MPGQLHNTNALKWSENTVFSYLEKMEEAVEDQKIYYLSRILLRLRLPLRVWSYWRHVFAEDERILDQMDRINEMIKDNLLSAALDGEVVASVAIFTLKNNYHMTDRPHTEVQRELRPDFDLDYFMAGGGHMKVLPPEQLHLTPALSKGEGGNTRTA